jgi:hypothetical protein
MKETVKAIRTTARAGIAVFFGYFTLCIFWFVDSVAFNGRYLAWSQGVFGRSESGAYLAGLALIASVLLLCASLAALALIRRAERKRDG